MSGRWQSSYVLPGLSAPAEILVDTWGIPHIYAENADDAFRVQGFNAARERLWQIDFWRRRGLGLLSEVFGPQYAERDRAARLFLYRGDMEAEWVAYGSDTKRASTAFVEGINAYVRLTRENPDLLPVEFLELGYRPALWAAEDVVRIRSHGLFYNVRQEVARALTLRDFGPEVEKLRRHLEPPHEPVIPDGLDLSLIPDDVLKVYDHATPLPLSPPLNDQDRGPVPSEGSNNWVVAAGRTATGRPMLANDPHRVVSLPSLRYLAHLCTPDFDVIGGGEPALPGISIGHNGRIAFGLTIFAIDQEDLYVYRTNPDNPLEYRYRERWEPMEVIREEIPVSNSVPAEAELMFTRHGPVIYADPRRRTAFAVRAAWLQPGMAPYLGSLEYLRAADGDQFLAAMNRWGAPPENQVYADTGGNIGWKACGLTPVRPNWDGTLPVPGDGRYEWAGFYDMDQLPGEANPGRGWLATANEMNLPPDFPAERVITYDWSTPYRRERIGEILDGNPAVTAQDMVALQNDYVSIPARRILRLLNGLTPSDAKAAEGVRMLRGWDGDLRADSAAAALFEVWYRRHLRPALLARALEQVLPAERRVAALSAILPAGELRGDARIDLQLLEDPAGRLGADPAGAIADIIATSLRDAVDDVAARLGEDRSQWAWGRLHRSRLRHPLADLLPDSSVQMSAGALPRGGSGDTVGNTTYTPDFTQSEGATFRIVIDVGNWDGSLAMNSPGQSGDVRSPHFQDLFESWAAGQAIPLSYSRAAVEKETQARIIITPTTGNLTGIDSR